MNSERNNKSEMEVDLTLNQVKETAFLARIKLTEEEILNFSQQISQITQAFSALQQVSTSGVSPLITPIEQKMNLRVDEAKVWPEVELALQNAPERQGNLFKVPPVV